MYLQKSVLGGAQRILKSREAGDSLIFPPCQEVGVRVGQEQNCQSNDK